jgi:rod shape-determining protein MreC
MNKKFLLFILILLLGGSYLFNIERLVQQKFIAFNITVQKHYVDVIEYIIQTFYTYIDQTTYIKQLQDQNQKNQKYMLLYDNNLNLLKQYQNDIKQDNLKLKDKFIPVTALSYLKLNDFTKVILNYDMDKNLNKTYALFTIDGYTAGTVMYKYNKTVAYLNQNKRSNYAVYIGKDKAPGITSGMQKDGYIVVNYVPVWKNILVGDEVITSNMDNIFPFGFKVGKVVSIKVNENTKQVFVKPYANTLGTKKFYLFQIDQAK